MTPAPNTITIHLPQQPLLLPCLSTIHTPPTANTSQLQIVCRLCLSLTHFLSEQNKCDKSQVTSRQSTAMDDSNMQQSATAYASASATATDWMEQLELPAQLHGGGQAAATPPCGHFDGHQTATKARSMNVAHPGVYRTQQAAMTLCDVVQLHSLLSTLCHCCAALGNR